MQSHELLIFNPVSTPVDRGVRTVHLLCFSNMSNHKPVYLEKWTKETGSDKKGLLLYVSGLFKRGDHLEHVLHRDYDCCLGFKWIASLYGLCQLWVICSWFALTTLPHALCPRTTHIQEVSHLQDSQSKCRINVWETICQTAADSYSVESFGGDLKNTYMYCMYNYCPSTWIY